jgi:CubicO group peptidase (beta-lactamase class C family)
MRMTKLILLASTAVLSIAACSALRLDRPVGVASGFTSHVLCDAAFVSGVDPDQTYAEAVAPMIGIPPVDWALRYEVDRAHRQVTTTIAGGFESRAIYRDGLGCIVTRGEPSSDAALPQDSADTDALLAPLLPAIAGPEVVEPKDEGLRAALDRAFAEADRPPYHHTKAVVVLRDRRVIAERYAPGYGIDTPILGWSATKSPISALIGILVRQGKLTLDQPAPLPAWRDASDLRHAITIDELLRQTSGIDLAETNSGFDPSTRMQFIEPDMAGFAQSVGLRAEPGKSWAYTDGNYILLSRIIRDAVGGTLDDVLRFERRELFGPLGMRHVTFEVDATGTPVGATYMLAPARDWARFGQLYLDDGVVGGKRILPEGWVRYSASQTLDTGYGAGFWTNLVDGNIREWGVPWGMAHAPRDAFFSRGAMGQFVIVVPSEHLVVARFGICPRCGDDIEKVDELVADLVAALHAPAATAHR